MGRSRRNVVRWITCLVMISAGAIACASLDNLAGSPDPDAGDDASAEGATNILAPDGAASPDAMTASTCAPRYLPMEGTYAYGHIFSADMLKIGDASLPTEPFNVPFFATVRHGTGGCWTFTAYLSNGAQGRHDHAWEFCNRCGDAGTSLDLVGEKDYFVSAGAPSAQRTAYTCGSPNAYLKAGVVPDASVPLAPCTGQTTGAQSSTIQLTSQGNRYLGQTQRRFADVDASVTCESYTGQRLVQIAGGGAAVASPHNWEFDTDSGLPMRAVLIAKTTTPFGGASVEYTFSLVFTRASPTVSPLLPAEDGGL